jgi:hypothetical protein
MSTGSIFLNLVPFESVLTHLFGFTPIIRSLTEISLGHDWIVPQEFDCEIILTEISVIDE